MEIGLTRNNLMSIRHGLARSISQCVFSIVGCLDMLKNKDGGNSHSCTGISVDSSEIESTNCFQLLNVLESDINERQAQLRGVLRIKMQDSIQMGYSQYFVNTETNWITYVHDCNLSESIQQMSDECASLYRENRMALRTLGWFHSRAMERFHMQVQDFIGMSRTDESQELLTAAKNVEQEEIIAELLRDTQGALDTGFELLQILLKEGVGDSDFEQNDETPTTIGHPYSWPMKLIESDLVPVIHPPM